MATDKKSKVFLITTVITASFVVGDRIYSYVEKQVNYENIRKTQIKMDNTMEVMNNNYIILNGTLTELCKKYDKMDGTVTKMKDGMIANNKEWLELFDKP